MLSDKDHNNNLYGTTIKSKSRDAILGEKYGERWAKYRSNWDKDIKTAEDIPDFPLQYEVQLTDACNLHCGICHSRKRTGQKLDMTFFGEAIKEGSQKGLSACSFGLDSEGLLKKDMLLKAIDLCRSNGIMDIILGTNGIMLDKTYSKELIDAGLTLINISLDAASSETYKLIRRSDSFNRVEKNIKDLISARSEQYGLPQVRLSFCKTYVNAHEEQAFVEKWQNCVDQVDIQHYISTVGDFRDLAGGKKINSKFCKDPFRRVGILANGDVQCCCCSFGHKDIIIGNLSASSMQDIWQGTKMRSIQDAFLTDLDEIPDYCKTCLGSRWDF